MKKRRHFELKVFDGSEMKFIKKENALTVKKALERNGIRVKMPKIKKVL